MSRLCDAYELANIHPVVHKRCALRGIIQCVISSSKGFDIVYWLCKKHHRLQTSYPY